MYTDMEMKTVFVMDTKNKEMFLFGGGNVAVL
jgi:hypothetical protein